MKILITIIKYALIITLLAGVFKIGQNLITQEKKITLSNIAAETKNLIRGTKGELTATEEKLLYKDVVFSIEETQKNEFLLTIRTKRTYPGCGFKISHKTTEKQFRTSVKLGEVELPEKQKCQNAEKPAAATIDLKLDRNLPTSLSIVRSLLVDKYSIELSDNTISVNPVKGAFSESTRKEFTRL